MNSRLLTLFFVCFLISFEIKAQGIPLITNYAPEDYGDNRQIWTIVQDTFGNIIFGNSSGLVKFNGNSWESIHVKTKGIVRSTLKSSDGTLYYGARNDFGIITSDSLNRFHSISLRDNLSPQIENIGDVFSILEFEERIFIQTLSHIIEIKEDSASQIDFSFNQKGIRVSENNLTTTPYGKKAFGIETTSLLNMLSHPFLESNTIFLIDKLKESYFVFVTERGFLKHSSNASNSVPSETNEYFLKHRPYKTATLDDKFLAVSTLSGGVVVLNIDGSIYQIIDESKGLPTNIVYDVFFDSEGNLWAGLDNGISKISIQKPITVYNQNNNIDGLISDLELFENQIFLGSTEGLFRKGISDFSAEALIPKQGVLSRVYDLSTYKNALWIAAPEGLFVYKNGELSITDLTGVLGFSSDSLHEFLLLRKGRSLFRLDKIDLNNRIEEEKVLESKEVIVDALYYNSKWLILGAQIGLQIFDQSGNLEKIIASKSEDIRYSFIKLFEEKITVGTLEGLFVFDEEADSLIRDDRFQDDEASSTQVSMLKKCENGSTFWLRNNRYLKKGSVDSSQESWKLEFIPYKEIGAGEAIYDVICNSSTDKIWFGGSNGLTELEDIEWKLTSSFNTNLNKIFVNTDSLIYGGYGDLINPIILPYQNNALRFTYSAASYLSSEPTQFQYRLSGFDSKWSSWSNESQKDYTNIPEGDYTFEVKSKNYYEAEGSIASFPFSILPPWYRTWWAYLTYFLLISGMLYTAYKIRVQQIIKVERLRNKIAGELHDEVSATLSSITYFAEAINRDENLDKKAKFVSLISESAGDAKEKITDIVWSINPENDGWSQFIAKCRRHASDLLESKDIKYSLKMDEEISGKMPMEFRQHLWLIYKEVLTNLARHSHARNVDIILKVENGEVQLTIQDDGVGFNLDKQRLGNGVNNIIKRSNMINGSISIDSSQGFGTRWSLKVKI